MTYYIELIKKEIGMKKIELFTDCVCLLDLRGRDLEMFAQECGFKLAIGVTRI